MRTGSLLLRACSPASIAYPETLVAIVLQLTFVRSHQFSIGGHNKSEPRADGLKLGKIVRSNRDRKLRSSCVGYVLLPVVFGESPSVFWGENLRNDHTGGLQSAATYWAGSTRIVRVLKIANKAATIAMDEVRSFSEERRSSVVHGGKHIGHDAAGTVGSLIDDNQPTRRVLAKCLAYALLRSLDDAHLPLLRALHAIEALDQKACQISWECVAGQQAPAKQEFEELLVAEGVSIVIVVLIIRRCRGCPCKFLHNCVQFLNQLTRNVGDPLINR